MKSESVTFMSRITNNYHVLPDNNIVFVFQFIIQVLHNFFLNFFNRIEIQARKAIILFFQGSFFRWLNFQAHGGRNLQLGRKPSIRF